MRVMRNVVVACLLAVPGVIAAQPSPVSDALRADLERYGKNLVAAAETMPAEKLGTKPTDKQMSFSDLIRHVAGGNTMICGWIAGQAPPKVPELPPSADKAALVGALKESFAYCRSALAGVDDSKLGEEVPFFGGRKVTRAAAMLDLTADWGDHYSLMATELRLAGLLPPTAQRQAAGESKQRRP